MIVLMGYRLMGLDRVDQVLVLVVTGIVWGGVLGSGGGTVGVV